MPCNLYSNTILDSYYPASEILKEIVCELTSKIWSVPYSKTHWNWTEIEIEVISSLLNRNEAKMKQSWMTFDWTPSQQKKMLEWNP